MAKTFPKVLRKDVYFAETGYIPHDSQRIIHADLTRHKALSNGRRWGKTLLGGKEAEVTCFVKNRLGEPQRGWIIGPNYSDCEKEFRVLYNSLQKLGVDQVSSKFLSNTENGNMHIATKWGWDVQCRSAARPETLVGEGLDWVLVVEAGRVLKKTFTEYIRPALSDKRGGSLMTGVPEIASDISLLYWAYKRGQQTNRAQWQSWRMPSWTNNIVFPGGRTDPEILEAEEDLTEDEFRRQYGGHFVEKIGRVMAEWQDEVHTRPLEYNRAWPVYGAVDYGFKNWFVFLWLQVDIWGNVYVLDETYIRLKDVEDICKEDLLTHPLCKHLVAFYPDPAEPGDTNTIIKYLKVPGRTHGSELKERLQLIWRAMKVKPEHGREEDKQPGLLVDSEKCTQLIWEMSEGYRWPEHKSQVKGLSEHPMDKDNHGPEALGRFFWGYFGALGETGRHARQSQVRYGR